MKKWIETHYCDLNDQHIEAINNFIQKFLRGESENLAGTLEAALRKVNYFNFFVDLEKKIGTKG